MNDYHRAPAVRYPVERPRTAVVALACVALLAGSLGLWWWLQQGRPLLQAAVFTAVWLLSGAAAWRSWCQLPTGHLAYDGARWSLLQGTDQSMTPLAWPLVRWDGQSFVLLSAECAPSGHCWLWLHRGGAPQLWPNLRRALHARVPVSSKEGV